MNRISGTETFCHDDEVVLYNEFVKTGGTAKLSSRPTAGYFPDSIFPLKKDRCAAVTSHCVSEFVSEQVVIWHSVFPQCCFLPSLYVRWCKRVHPPGLEPGTTRV